MNKVELKITKDGEENIIEINEFAKVNVGKNDTLIIESNRVLNAETVYSIKEIIEKEIGCKTLILMGGLTLTAITTELKEGEQ